MHKYFIILFSFVASSMIYAGEIQKNINATLEDHVILSNSIIIFGASYAKAWDIDTIAGLHVINKGVGGNETSEMLSRYDVDVVRHNPRVIIIWGFINDIFRSTEGNVSDKILQTKENIQAMVDISISNGITPILATELTIRPPNTLNETIMGFIGRLRGKKSYSDYVNRYVVEVNDWIRSFSKDQKIQLLDFDKILAGKGGIRKQKFAVEDGSHLTKEAYNALSAYIRDVEISI